MPRVAMCRSPISARWCARSASFGDLSKELLERFQARNGIVMRQVEVQGCDGDVSILHRLEIRSFAGMPRRRIAADPVVLSPSRIEALDDALGINALAEPRHAHALKFGHRKIHIQNDPRIARSMQNVLRQLSAEFRAAIE